MLEAASGRHPTAGDDVKREGGRRGAGNAAAGGNGKTTPRDHSTRVSNLTEARAVRAGSRTGRMRWFKWWLIEQAGRTTNLSATAMGAYTRLLGEYLRTKGPLPDDARMLAKIARVPRRDWPDIHDELEDVFELVDGHLVDEYAEKRLAEFRAMSVRNRRNIRVRYDVGDTHIEDSP